DHIFRSNNARRDWNLKGSEISAMSNILLVKLKKAAYVENSINEHRDRKEFDNKNPVNLIDRPTGHEEVGVIKAENAKRKHGHDAPHPYHLAGVGTNSHLAPFIGFR